MTREEQLACLKDRPCDVCKMRTDKGCSSWECVFEQAPDDENSNREQEPCEDAISRQAVLDAIEDDNRNGHYSCFASNNDAQCFKGVIGELPSVNLQESMREFTEEEAKAYSKALDKMYKPTGFNVFNEPCEDAISRQAAIDIIAETDITNGEEPVFTGRQVQALLKDLPSVKPQEPKTGHWKRISMDKYSEHAKYWYRCDRCGKDNLGNTDWCPNCGCRMVDPQERSEKG